MEPAALPPSVTQIRAWISYEEHLLSEIRSRLDLLKVDERQIEDRLAGLRQLHAAYEPVKVKEQAEGRTAPAIPRSVTQTVRDRVREILRESSDPVHINDIHRAFGERGWPVPGAGTAANITAHLSHAPDIVSPRRGFYRVLTEGEQSQGLPQRKVARRTARSSSRKK